MRYLQAKWTKITVLSRGTDFQGAGGLEVDLSLVWRSLTNFWFTLSNIIGHVLIALHFSSKHTTHIFFIYSSCFSNSLFFFFFLLFFSSFFSSSVFSIVSVILPHHFRRTRYITSLVWIHTRARIRVNHVSIVYRRAIV